MCGDRALPVANTRSLPEVQSSEKDSRSAQRVYSDDTAIFVFMTPRHGEPIASEQGFRFISYKTKTHQKSNLIDQQIATGLKSWS
jgi:hypothetical protein